MSDQRYLVTARKYRPQRFHEIVAQEHVSETLKNAIRLDRLAHAYLFSGPRGVGKTTAARILAKAINCQAPLEQRGDGEPCRVCESCKTFEEGRSLNILEIDAASNNRVEDIRELRETILIPPQGSRKKVYIIDEVHMLSNAAFNALLKTLEEPPPHALFIFATTEPNKVLPTILSRCQRFDFRRISVPEIVVHLENICRTESITADEASLMLIAHKGDGALRDALSAFDQAVSLCGTSLAYPELARAFGVVEVDLFFEVTQFVTDGQNAGLLNLVDRIIRQGYDLQEFLVGLAAHIRNLLVARTMPDTSLIEAAESVKQRYSEACKQYAEIDLLRMLMVVADGEDQLKTSMQPRLQLELTLLKIAAMPNAVDVQSALETLERLEKDPGIIASQPAVSSPKPVPAPKPAAEAQPVATQPVATPQPEASPEPPPSPVATLQETSPMPPAPPPPEAVSETFVQPPAPPEAVAQHIDIQPPAAPLPPEAATQAFDMQPPIAPPPEMEDVHRSEPSPKAPPVEHSAAPAPVATSSRRASYQGLFGAPALHKINRPNTSEGDTSAVAHEDVMVAEMPSAEIEGILAQWEPYLNKIKVDRIHVSALLQNAKPTDFRAETLVLTVPDEFHKRMLSSQEDYLLEHLTSFVQQTIGRISYIVDLNGMEEQQDVKTSKEVDPREYMQRKRQDNPVIRAIFDEFGGEMVW